MKAIIYILLIIITDITSYYFQMYEVIYATPLVLMAWVAQISSLPYINRMAEKMEHPELFYKISVGIDTFCVLFIGFCIGALIIYRYEVSNLLLIAFGVKIAGVQLLLWQVARDYGKLCEEIRQHDRSRLPGQRSAGERRN